jgi:chromosome segregation ATPase
VQEAAEPIGWLDANAELVGVPRRRLARAESRSDRIEAQQAKLGAAESRVKETENDMASWEADLDDGIGLVERRADEAGLVSRVSAASFQVSKATEGLEQVAGLLRTAEEFAKNADTERREAEEALELVETQRAELSQMLALARSEAAAAERRAVAAEERLQEALERTFALESRLDDGPRAEPDAGGPRQLTELRRRLMTSIMSLTLAMKHADPSSTNGATMIEEVGASVRRLERLVVQLIELDGIADGSFVPNDRRVVADATAVGSAADRTVTEQLRELSSFDDLSDEVAT